MSELSEYFVRTPSTMLRAGVLWAVGGTTYNVYMVLRDNVWHGKKAKDPTIQAALTEGKLVASIPLREIAVQAGLSKADTVSEHIDRLIGLGWIERLQPWTPEEDDLPKPKISKKAGVYVLGDREGDLCIFTADEWAEETFEALCVYVREQLGPTATWRDFAAITRAEWVEKQIKESAGWNLYQCSKDLRDMETVRRREQRKAKRSLKAVVE